MFTACRISLAVLMLQEYILKKKTHTHYSNFLLFFFFFIFNSTFTPIGCSPTAGTLLLAPPVFLGVLVALVGGGGCCCCCSCSSPTAMMSTRISRWSSCCLSAWPGGEEGMGRDRESDGGHTISASASARSRCSGVCECWWVSSDDSSGKERSQAEQLNWERDCDDKE